MMALASGICFFMEARKSFDELLRRDEEYTRAVLEASQATYPMASYGAPSYAPSYPDYQSQPSYAGQMQTKPNVSTQPSYGVQSDYNYDSEKVGHGGSGSEKAGYGGGYSGSQSGYGGSSQQSYGQQSYGARA